jgi:hypothetical protein
MVAHFIMNTLTLVMMQKQRSNARYVNSAWLVCSSDMIDRCIVGYNLLTYGICFGQAGCCVRSNAVHRYMCCDEAAWCRVQFSERASARMRDQTKPAVKVYCTSVRRKSMDRMYGRISEVKVSFVRVPFVDCCSE